MACLAEPSAVRPNWLVSYKPAANGKASESVAVPLGNGSPLLVTVVSPGTQPAHPGLRFDKREVQARLVGYDSVSRLALLQIDGGITPQAIEWRNDAGDLLGSPLQAMTTKGAQSCRASHRINQLGSKILPLSLLQVNFSQAVPPPGTPLLDPQGRVAAIVFQTSGNGNIGYAIPAEAVHRVRKDLVNGGHLQRGWLGLSLRAESKSPRIVKVIPNSPAAIAGIMPADVLLNVGSRRISDYADAADAFFYLIPGESVQVKLLRGTTPLEFMVTPTRPKAE